jgi:hypothetical protein
MYVIFLDSPVAGGRFFRSQRMSRANPKWESSPPTRRTLFGAARLERGAAPAFPRYTDHA